jgi:hypothetical protein
VLWTDAKIVGRIYGYVYTSTPLDIHETVTYPIATLTTPVANSFITEATQATVHAYTGISISGGKITLTEDHTIQELYDYIQDYLSLNPTVTDFFSTIDGTNYTCTYDIDINACILTGTGKRIVMPTKTMTLISTGAFTGIVTDINGTKVAITITVKTLNGTAIENARVLLEADTGGSMPYNTTVTITNSGTTATVTHATHGMASNDYVVIRNASLQVNNGVHQITKTGTSSYTYVLDSAPGSNPTGTIKATYIAVTGLTNSSGIISSSGVFPTNQPSVGKVRKSTGSPIYKTANIVGTIDAVTGFSTSIQMIVDE